MATEKRLVITGLGVLSCIGNDVDSFWQALASGKSGIAPFDPMPEDEFLLTDQGGQVRGFEPLGKQYRRMERFSQFATKTSFDALAMAGLSDLSQLDKERCGVVFGNATGGLIRVLEGYSKYKTKNGRVHPLMVPLVISNMVSGNVAITTGFNGPNLAVNTACASGNHAIATAAGLIKSNQADLVIAGGSDTNLNTYIINSYASLTALSSRKCLPTEASCPFSKNRDGFVIAEGSGALVIESLEHATQRKVNILAELSGFGLTNDSFHITAPDPQYNQTSRAMQLALDTANLKPQDISYINAHGTSTPLNDLYETRAIERIFPDPPPVSSFKSMIGHCLTGAAAIEAVGSVMALQKGIIPPTINLHEPDPELTLDYVPLKARQANLEHVMSNSFGFGGHNSAIILSRFRA